MHWCLHAVFQKKNQHIAVMNEIIHRLNTAWLKNGPGQALNKPTKDRNIQCKKHRWMLNGTLFKKLFYGYISSLLMDICAECRI